MRRYGDREGIEVEERYTGGGTFWVLEEQEPVLYYRDQGFLHRLFLTRQGGKLVPASGSGDTRFLPAVLEAGASWDSATVAFQVQTGETGFQVTHRHVLNLERDVVRVPAGSFSNCIRVDTYSSHGPGSGAHGDEIVFYYSDWYAPGVGLVRTQQWDDEKRTRERSRIELLDYVNREGATGDGS